MGTGAVVTHPYAAAGSYEVRLTVSDSASATGTTTRTVEPSTDGVALVGAASANANATTHRVGVPPGTRAGDALVLFMTTNSTTTTVNAPAGWTALETLDGSSVRGRAWTRTATAADAAGGAVVSVVASGTTKADLTLAAYRATGGSGTTVAGHAGTAASTSGTDHSSPETTNTRSGQLGRLLLGRQGLGRRDVDRARAATCAAPAPAAPGAGPCTRSSPTPATRARPARSAVSRRTPTSASPAWSRSPSS